MPNSPKCTLLFLNNLHVFTQRFMIVCFQWCLNTDFIAAVAEAILLTTLSTNVVDIYPTTCIIIIAVILPHILSHNGNPISELA